MEKKIDTLGKLIAYRESVQYQADKLTIAAWVLSKYKK